MTIAIKVTNTDSREKAVVRVSNVHKGDKSLVPVTTNHVELKGGESKDVHVYDGQSVIVEEVQNG